MTGIALLLGYMVCGVVAADGWFAKRGRVTRVWLGLVMGFLMMMWLPSLWAFAFRFSRLANNWAFCSAVVIAALSRLFGGRFSSPAAKGDPGEPDWKWTLALVLPAVLLFAYLQYTHYFRQADGALYVGQSTYSDICMHSAIITSLQNAAYPPEYSILPGNILGYPFLADALSATMLLYGTPLALSMTIPGTIMGGLVFWGFCMLCRKLGCDKRAGAVAYLLLFLNGGLGFLYTFDLAGEDASAIVDLFTGYYLAPANMPALNLRWVNIVCDMLLPQRTFLAGCMLYLPALWLLADAYACREERLSNRCARTIRGERRSFIALGVLAGAMPMVHTHSFLSLGILTGGVLLATCVRERRVRALEGYILYGGITMLLALPQLLLWTFPQTQGAGGLRLWLGWVNNENGALRDETIWFWVKNMGLVFLIAVPAAIQSDRRCRALAAGAALAFLTANVIQFQRLLYDNNKIMYASYIVFCPLIGMYLVKVYDALRGFRGRAFLAACFLSVSLLSGALSVARETVSDYRLFDASEVLAAKYLRDEATEHAVVLTGGQHNNFASVLAGKNLVCGYAGHLFTHGLAYDRQSADARAMYENPAQSTDLFEQYAVSYVMITNAERAQYAIDEAWFQDNTVCVFDDGVRLYSLESDEETP